MLSLLLEQKIVVVANYPHDPSARLNQLHQLLDWCKEAAKEHAVAAKSVVMKYPNMAAISAKNMEIIPELYKEMFSTTPWEHSNP